MAFRDFIRGDRERQDDERYRDRWRSMEGDWRDEDRGAREYEQRGAERGWSPGSEYLSERSQSYRGGAEDYGRGAYGEQLGRYGRSSGASSRRDMERSYEGDYGDRSSGDVYGRSYGGAAGYTGSGYGESYSRSAGRSYGEGGYGRYAGDEGRRGAFGFGGYGGQGGAQTTGGGRMWEQGSQQAIGEHRGKGPRGYRRSDERVREDVCDRLTDDPFLDASNIEVTVKDCEVTLSGAVNSREDKRRAEDLIERISGVRDVTNNLRVAPQAQQPGAERAASLPARH